MSEFLISIIIPCYNVEKYVGRCIKSLLLQTIGYQNLQIILVNDASTDNTLAVLEEYEKAFPDNIMVITYDENIRQGGARNVGMQYALGKYIGFIDSDDWIEPPMYKELYEKMETGDYDLVKCKMGNDCSEELTGFATPLNQKNQDILFSETNGYYWGTPNEKEQGINGAFGGVVTGLYRRDFLFEHELFFPEKCAYEDNYWGAILKLYVRRMYIIDIPYYHYYQNMESTVRTRNSVRHYDRIKIQEDVLDAYDRLGVIEVFYDKILNECIKLYYLNTFFLLFDRFDECPDVSIYNRISGNIYRFFPDWMNYIDITSKLYPEQLLLNWLDRFKVCEQNELKFLREKYLEMAGI